MSEESQQADAQQADAQQAEVQRVAVTGGTGFIGRYILRELLAAGKTCRAWRRADSDVSGFESVEPGRLEWVDGELGDRAAAERLVKGCQGVVHAGLYRTGSNFRGNEGDLEQYAQINLMGSLQLIEAARASGAGRFVFISTCAVHERILDDRALDENHPRTPTSHYGAYKAAVEMFVQSHGLGQGYPICSLRPCGVYGLAHRVEDSKWFDLVQQVVQGQTVHCRRGGKEVHAGDVAKAAALLLAAPDVAGQIYNCCDLYVSEFEVARLSRQLSGAGGQIEGEKTSPKHVISTTKLEAKLEPLGFRFGRRPTFGGTIRQLVAAVQAKRL